MTEISIALVASVYIIMKITERIVKNYSHKKIVEVQEYEKEKDVFKAQIAIAEKNFSILEEEIREIRDEMAKLNETDLDRFGRIR